MNQPNFVDPALCEECGLHPRRGALAVCHECCEKAWSEGQSKESIPTVKTNWITCGKCGVMWYGSSEDDSVVACPQCTKPKPPFFLWDFRSRKVCDLSYLYGGMLGLAVGLTIGSMDSSGWFNVAAVFCLVISKYLHSKLPLSK